MQSHLEKTGAAVELAGNGEEALGAFEKFAVDLILVDL